MGSGFKGSVALMFRIGLGACAGVEMFMGEVSAVDMRGAGELRAHH